jgi:hypothetical protein
LARGLRFGRWHAHSAAHGSAASQAHFSDRAARPTTIYVRPGYNRVLYSIEPPEIEDDEERPVG